jgi:hypothetical protein
MCSDGVLQIIIAQTIDIDDTTMLNINRAAYLELKLKTEMKPFLRPAMKDSTGHNIET